MKPTAPSAVVRYLTIPQPIALDESDAIKTASKSYSFLHMFAEVVTLIPCGTGDQADTLETLIERLGSVKPGDVVELREADYAALLAAVQAWRQKVPGPVQLKIAPIFATVARASTRAPVEQIATAAE